MIIFGHVNISRYIHLTSPTRLRTTIKSKIRRLVDRLERRKLLFFMIGRQGYLDNAIIGMATPLIDNATCLPTSLHDNINIKVARY